MARVFVCQASELAEGEARKVDCQPAAVAVFRLASGLFATADMCSHGNASMSEGYLEDDGTVECPLHAARFCLTTGRALCLPATDPLPTFAVCEENGAIYVDVPEGAA